MPGVSAGFGEFNLPFTKSRQTHAVVIRSDLPDTADQVTGADERLALWLVRHCERNWSVLLYPRVMY